MWELLFPGVTVYVRPATNPKRRTAYDVVGIERDGIPILLDTQYNNDTAAWLVQEHRIPGWEDWDLIRREVTVGDSRFDLLLGRGEERFFVEVSRVPFSAETAPCSPMPSPNGAESISWN